MNKLTTYASDFPYDFVKAINNGNKSENNWVVCIVD